MSQALPANKKMRVDPHALDDDALPPKGTSVLGKRHRNQDNNYFYGNQETQVVNRNDPTSNDSKDDNDISMDANMNTNNNTTDNSNTNNDGNNNLNTAWNNQPNNNNNDNNNNNLASEFGWKLPAIKYEKGAWIDIQIEDEDDHDLIWVTGVMVKQFESQVQVHVPRGKLYTLPLDSKKLAPVGTHTDGFT